MNILENDKIKLRATEPEDIDFIYELENNSNFWDIADTNEPFSKYIIKEYIAYSNKSIYEKKQQRLMIDLKCEKKTIGCIDLYNFDPIHKRAGVCIFIDTKYQRKGFAFEALTILKNYTRNFLHIHQLYCYIAIDNEASIHLFKKANFKEIGILKDWIKTYGKQYKDVGIFTLIL